MSAIRFAFIASDYKPMPGGIAAYIDALARGLIELGHDARVLAVVQPHEKERRAFLNDYQAWVSPFQVAHDVRPRSWVANKFVSSLEIVRCLSPRARNILRRTSFFRASAGSIARLEEVLAEQRPTVVVLGHLDLNLYPLVLLLLERRLPYVIVAHDVEIRRCPSRINDRVRRGLMLKGARLIAANSHHTKSLVEAWGISKHRVKIVHPPIAEEAIRESAGLQCAPRERADFNLVTICRLVKGKGIDIVLRALKILTAKQIPCRYVIGGKGDEREFLETLASDLGLKAGVQFKGSITEDEKWHLLRNADVFVMPSRVDTKVQHEGFGIAFVEAAAFGVPGVGTRAGGIPDSVVDGRTGILVPQESPESLAEALCFLYRNPKKRREMGRTALLRARAEFSPTAIAARFRDEVSRVL